MTCLNLNCLFRYGIRQGKKGSTASVSRFIEGQIAASLFMMLTYTKHLKLSKLGITISSDRFFVFCIVHAYLALVSSDENAISCLI